MAAVLLNKLQPGKTYTVAVKALDSDGNISENSITYTFTTPTANLDGTALVGYNSAVNVAVGASGAMTAGTMDLNGLQKAGQLDLDDVWNTTNLSNGGGYASITGNIGGVMVLNKNGLMGYQITSNSTHIDIPITASFGSISSTINGTIARSSASISSGSVLTIGQAVNSIKVYNVSNKITASANLLYNDYTKTASGSNVGAKIFVNFYSSAGTFLGNVVGASIVVPNAQDTSNYLSISASATASAYSTTSTAHITIDFYPIAGSAIAASTSFFFTNPITTNSGEIIGSSSGIAKFLLNNKTGDAYFGGTIFTTSKIGTLPIVDWTASQINNNPLVGSAYNLAALAFSTAFNAQTLAGSAYNLAASGFSTAFNAQTLAGSAYNVAASALLSADSASTNALNYLGVKNTSISGSALISSANTITNASNQLTTISSNGITITTASGASASSASGARIVLNSVGFASYNASGSPTVTITAADGTARFTGSVIATAGLIGGFNLTASNQNGDAQMYIGTASQQNWTGMIPGTQWSFFSGATDNLGTSALFRVSNAGLLYAQNAVITGSITAQYGVIGNWNIGSQSLWAGTASQQNFAGMIPGTLNVFFGGATSSAADNATFRVTNTGSVLATAGQIGGWSIGENTLRSNTLTRNMILNSASNAISFTDISGSIIANIVSGSTTNPANFPLGEAFIIYSGSQIKYNGSLYPQVALQANNLEPIGTTGYLGVYSSSTTYLELDPTNAFLTAYSAITLATDNANITIQNNGVTGSIDLISKTRINIGNTSDMASKSIYIGYGTSAANNSNVYLPGVYYNTTGTSGNVFISTSGLLYRSTSTFNIKENIFPLSKYSNLSEKIPKNKIINNEIYDVEDVLKLTPVSFTSLVKEEFGEKYYGFIAEDVAEKTPNLATYDDYGNPIYYQINGIVASMLAVVQNQQEKIKELEQRLALLENK